LRLADVNYLQYYHVCLKTSKILVIAYKNR
jgi:hypothetical protein